MREHQLRKEEADLKKQMADRAKEGSLKVSFFSSMIRKSHEKQLSIPFDFSTVIHHLGS